MAYELPWRWILPVLLVTTTTMGQDFQATQTADMESSDCDKIGAYTIDDQDVMLVSANPPQVPGGTATRDNCVVEVRTQANRRLRIYVMDVSIFDCGTRVDIFDGNTHMISPAIVLNCDSNPPTTYDSRSEAIRIRLAKQSPSSLNFRLNIVITTDQGPDISFEQAMSSYNQPLSIGAYVGLGVAGGLVFIALVAIAIYCIVKQRKKNLDAEKAIGTGPPVYTSENSKVSFPRKDRHGHESSSNDSHNSSYSSGDGRNMYVNMNPDPKGRAGRGNKGYDNRAYASSDDGGHDRSRDSTGSDDVSAGQVNGSFDSTSDAPSRRRFSKHQENGNASGSISRSARRGSARSKSHKRKDSASEDKKGVHSSRRSRSSSGHRSGHRDSGRRSRSHGERGGSQRRSRSRSPHSQSSTQSSAFDSKGHNRMYDISSMSKRSRESSNSSTSSRDSGDERTVSLDPSGRRPRDRGHVNRAMAKEEDQYGSQV